MVIWLRSGSTGTETKQVPGKHEILDAHNPGNSVKMEKSIRFQHFEACWMLTCWLAIGAPTKSEWPLVVQILRKQTKRNMYKVQSDEIR
jgi:hypothetical protein